MKTEKSREIYHRSQAVIAHGALTNSKRPECFVRGVYPTHIKRGFGCELWDIDDKRYIDYICALGTNLVGYANHEIHQAVVDQLKFGTTFSLGTELEVQYAERLKGLLPFLEQFRFLKTGTEACAAAVRIARAYTKRSIVVSEGYHGWSDDFVSLTAPANGVPQRGWMLSTATDNQAHENHIAAYIVEPVITDWSEDRVKQLRELRSLCDKIGALLIFDETITGFRVPGLCVASHFGVEPDLIIFGKACGGGFPLSVLAGKTRIMSEDYFVSSTFAGDTVALRAGMKLLDMLAGEYRLDRLWDEGKVFMSEFNAINPKVAKIEGYPTRGVFKFRDETTKALFFQESCKAGYLVGPSFFFNFHHAKYTHQAIAMFQTIIGRIANGEVSLEGEMPVLPFAERVRQQ
jgi:glutamate-1-semialdehyde 2,1-aminomutase